MRRFWDFASSDFSDRSLFVWQDVNHRDHRPLNPANSRCQCSCICIYMYICIVYTFIHTDLCVCDHVYMHVCICRHLCPFLCMCGHGPHTQTCTYWTHRWFEYWLCHRTSSPCKALRPTGPQLLLQILQTEVISTIESPSCDTLHKSACRPRTPLHPCVPLY